MNKEKCSMCEDYVYDEITDYHINSHNKLVCDDCGIKTHCFCDCCGGFVPASECIVSDQCSASIEITEVCGKMYNIAVCGQCQDEEE